MAGRLQLDLPAIWEVSLAGPAPVVVVGVEIGEAQPFRASVVVTVDEIGELGLDEWQRGVEVLLPSCLDGFALLDLERVNVAGRPGARRLATYSAPGGASATMEQWVTVFPGLGVTVTATTATVAHAAYADLTASIAASVSLEGNAR